MRVEEIIVMGLTTTASVSRILLHYYKTTFLNTNSRQWLTKSNKGWEIPVSKREKKWNVIINYNNIKTWKMKKHLIVQEFEETSLT